MSNKFNINFDKIKKYFDLLMNNLEMNFEDSITHSYNQETEENNLTYEEIKQVKGESIQNENDNSESMSTCDETLNRPEEYPYKDVDQHNGNCEYCRYLMLNEMQKNGSDAKQSVDLFMKLGDSSRNTNENHRSLYLSFQDIILNSVLKKVKETSECIARLARNIPEEYDGLE